MSFLETGNILYVSQPSEGSTIPSSGTGGTQTIMQNLPSDVTTAQELFWDAPEGRPTSVVSVSVFRSNAGDDSSPETATVGVAMIEANPETTLTAVAGFGLADTRVVSLADTTDIEVGRTYLVKNAAGESERVEIMAISPSNTVEVRHTLRNTYEAGDSFQSTRITIGLDPVWIADSTNISDDLDPNPGYRIRWVYIENGKTRVHDDYLNVTRYTGRHSVIPRDVTAIRTNWLNDLPVEHLEDRGRQLIDTAYEQLVLDLARINIPAEMMRNRSVVNQLVIRKALLLESENRAVEGGDITAYEIDRELYSGLIDSLLRTTGKVQIASDTSGAANALPRVRASRR